ncbi:hypothetical protein [Sphaerimonospora thailandensis]|uniref:Uncharacterized protein n=1 Tax=Sphaerimonospora thailandensis TaxID=795644 RepID=A0A8J3VXT0_9ACTN|nr:hypothetical protein [Sphaerimonospora thailandensis]GIH69244.1 hypothetical protein Mth01_14970 [Sphaerimonospora thailandensis]
MSAQRSDRGKGLAFAVAVVVLAAVGLYLTMNPPTSESEGGDGRTAAAEPAARSPEATGGAVRSPVPRQVATTPAVFDVYAYLPLSRQELGAAADLARRFTESYGTFRYDEEPAAFAGRLKAFATDEFAAQLTRAMTDPGLVERNRAGRVVSRASAEVKKIRDMTADQVVFVVGSVRHVTGDDGDKDENDRFAVTVIRAGSDWRVYDLELADAGQDGDTTP